MNDRESILPLALGLAAAVLIHVVVLGALPLSTRSTAAAAALADDHRQPAAPDAVPARAPAAKPPVPARNPPPRPTDQPAPPAASAHPRALVRRKPEDAKEPEVPIGSDHGADVATVAWISYDDFRRLMARRGTVDQPALQSSVDPTPGAPIQSNPTPPAAMHPAPRTPGLPGQPGAPASPGGLALATPTPPAPQTPTPPRAADIPKPVVAPAAPPKPVAPPAATSPPTPTPEPPRQSPRPPAPPDDQGRLAMAIPGSHDLPGMPPPPLTPAILPPREPSPPPAITPEPKPPATRPAPVTGAASTPPQRHTDSTPVSPALPVNVIKPAATAHPPPGQAGAGGAAGPAENARPTSLPRTDRESDPFSASTDTINVVPGRVVTRKGIEIKTVEPRFNVINEITALPVNPEARITFSKDGQVLDVKIIKSSGFAGFDSPIIVSLFKWKASGEKLKDIKNTFDMTVRLILVDDPDPRPGEADP